MHAFLFTSFQCQAKDAASKAMKAIHEKDIKISNLNILKALSFAARRCVIHKRYKHLVLNNKPLFAQWCRSAKTLCTDTTAIGITLQ
jgi:hypothetical protein